MTDNSETNAPPATGDVVREQDKIMLVLAYLGIFALIPLLTVKDSEYVKWHAKQGLALFAVGFGFWMLTAVIGLVSNWLSCIIWPIGMIGLLVVTVMAIVKAFEPNRWKIPVVSQLAEKF